MGWCSITEWWSGNDQRWSWSDKGWCSKIWWATLVMMHTGHHHSSSWGKVHRPLHSTTIHSKLLKTYPLHATTNSCMRTSQRTFIYSDLVWRSRLEHFFFHMSENVTILQIYKPFNTVNQCISGAWLFVHWRCHRGLSQECVIGALLAWKPSPA